MNKLSVLIQVNKRKRHILKEIFEKQYKISIKCSPSFIGNHDSKLLKMLKNPIFKIMYIFQNSCF